MRRHLHTSTVHMRPDLMPPPWLQADRRGGNRCPRRFLTHDVIALRDRSLVAVLFFCGARISAALALTPRDWYREGRRYRIRLHEKGGHVHVLPLHREAREHLELYVETSGVAAQPTAPIFRAVTRARQLTERPLSPLPAWQMIRRRARRADLATNTGCHTFRASAITLLRRQGATLEVAQRFAGIASRRRRCSTTAPRAICPMPRSSASRSEHKNA
jgi:integrase/recombinase XerD